MTTETVTTETEVSKKSRNVDTRDAQQRVYLDSENWLDIPNYIETEFLDQGFKLGWLRITINGDEDHKAVGKKINEGWEFVTAKEVPDMTVGYGYSKQEGRFENCIIRGDVALAKIPMDIYTSRKQKGLDRNREMNEAVDQRLMSMQDRRMPISNNSNSRVTVGNKPKFDS